MDKNIYSLKYMYLNGHKIQNPVHSSKMRILKNSFQICDPCGQIDLKNCVVLVFEVKTYFSKLHVFKWALNFKILYNCEKCEF
jgi:hypothetical protein